MSTRGERGGRESEKEQENKKRPRDLKIKEGASSPFYSESGFMGSEESFVMEIK